ncbi:hypothetical protein DL89DRAFT_264390 [Linderina pennispora]|uniref:Uncharacterized protein n=1 Tax=Linderina pennispora TaxID=61395 RepID=A0A1Y1WMD2_9FUNG|nr:uncharacterized protein DL89DRAFT_264390 [Linderina pennispora]ORX74545.1 hypothetical protein DL89DRAFT_264390 [Linderina pennispora]
MDDDARFADISLQLRKLTARVNRLEHNNIRLSRKLYARTAALVSVLQQSASALGADESLTDSDSDDALITHPHPHPTTPFISHVMQQQQTSSLTSMLPSTPVDEYSLSPELGPTTTFKLQTTDHLQTSPELSATESRALNQPMPKLVPSQQYQGNKPLPSHCQTRTKAANWAPSTCSAAMWPHIMPRAQAAVPPRTLVQRTALSMPKIGGSAKKSHAIVQSTRLLVQILTQLQTGGPRDLGRVQSPRTQVILIDRSDLVVVALAEGAVGAVKIEDTRHAMAAAAVVPYKESGGWVAHAGPAGAVRVNLGNPAPTAVVVSQEGLVAMKVPTGMATQVERGKRRSSTIVAGESACTLPNMTPTLRLALRRHPTQRLLHGNSVPTCLPYPPHPTKTVLLRKIVILAYCRLATDLRSTRPWPLGMANDEEEDDDDDNIMMALMSPEKRQMKAMVNIQDGAGIPLTYSRLVPVWSVCAWVPLNDLSSLFQRVYKASLHIKSAVQEFGELTATQVEIGNHPTTLLLHKKIKQLYFYLATTVLWPVEYNSSTTIFRLWTSILKDFPQRIRPNGVFQDMWTSTIDWLVLLADKWLVGKVQAWDATLDLVEGLDVADIRGLLEILPILLSRQLGRAKKLDLDDMLNGFFNR